MFLERHAWSHGFDVSQACVVVLREIPSNTAMTTIVKMVYFYYTSCPLCQLDVNETLDCYYLIPSNPTRLFSHLDGDIIPETDSLKVRDFKLTKHQCYPSLEYKNRSFILHKRCYELIRGLSPSQLCFLIDIIEPTFPAAFTSPPRSQANRYGAFSHVSSFHARASNGQILDRLPPEIRNMVFEHDVGLLQFVMKTKSQIIRSHRDLGFISPRRFTEKTLTVKGDMVRIHLTIVGGRVYISHLSDLTGIREARFWRFTVTFSFLVTLLPCLLYTYAQQSIFKHAISWYSTGFGLMLCLLNELLSCHFRQNAMCRRLSRDCRLDNSHYLAVKSDGIGVIDVAFRQAAVDPEWILDSSAKPFKAEISVNRNANVRKLRIIRDVLHSLPFLKLKIY